MAEYLQSSLLCRAWNALFGKLSSLFRGSCILAFLAALWRDCFTRRIFISGGQRLIGESAAYDLARRGNERLARAHGIGAAVRDSLLWRVPAAIFRVGKGSRLVFWLFSGGMTGLVLILLGLYGGVDWLLRDALSVPILSSLWDELLFAFCLAWIVWLKVDRKEAVLPRLNPMDLSTLVFPVIGLCLLIMICPYPAINFSGYRAACQYVLWFFVVTRLIRSDADFKRLYGAMLVLAGLVALHGIYQYIVAVPIPSGWTDAAEQDVRTRVFSIFGSPNIMADYMVMFAPLCAGLAYYTKNFKLKLAAWFFTFCMCFSCLFTMSRGGWVAMAVAILVFAVLVDKRLLLLMLAAAAVSLMLPFVASRIGYLFTDSFAESTARGGREGRWEIGLKLLYEAIPMLGLGHGMFGGAIAMQNKVHSVWAYFYLDNYYIKTLVEMGYLGLGAFLTALIGWLLTGMRCLKRCGGTKQERHDKLYPLCAGIFAGQCGVLVHCYFENIFEEPYMQAYFWILCAMLVWAGFLRKRKNTS